MKQITYRSVLTLAVAGLVLVVAPNAASARQASVPLAARAQASPTFVFPSSGQTFPLNGSMLFQVQPVSGAQGYLWSFVQNGAVVWQNLAWDGRLGGATDNVGKGSRAEGHMHGGAMQVWVRAWMGGAQWSGLSSLGVRLQGAASGPVQPQTVKPQPVQPTHPAPGTTLYYADTSGGLDKWTGSSDWKHVNGMLVNDGNGSTDRWIRAPYQPSDGANYAVEAEIQVVRNCHTFGIIARAKGQGNYAAGAWCENGSAQIWAWSNDATNYNTLTRQSRNQKRCILGHCCWPPAVIGGRKEWAAMTLLTDRYAAQIAGVVSCYDRIVIMGTLPGVCYAEGMAAYLRSHGIRLFD